MANGTGFGAYVDPHTLANQAGNPSYTDVLTNTNAGLNLQLQRFGAPGVQQGLGNFLSILQNRGQPDPAIWNRQVSEILRGSEGLRQQVAGGAASRNMQNSGVTAAIDAALGSAAQDRVADTRARQTATGEQREMQALNLLLSLMGLMSGQGNQLTSTIAAKGANDFDLGTFLGSGLQAGGTAYGGYLAGR